MTRTASRDSRGWWETAAAALRGVLPDRIAHPRAARLGFRVTRHGDTIQIRQRDRAVRIAARHAMYQADVCTHFDAYWGAVEPTVVDGVHIVDYSAPKLHTYRETGLSFWLSAMAEEPIALRAYFDDYTPAAGELVFDLGANCGVSTHYLAQAVGPTGRVVAFEPDPDNFTLLERNVALHGLTNVVPVRKAIGARTERRAFNTEGALGSGFTDVVPRGAGGARAMVDVISFADACEFAGSVPSFVKMDVEGAEVEIVDALPEFLRGRRIHFVVDTNHHVGGTVTGPAVERAFSRAGYRAWTSDRFGLATTWAAPPA